MTAPPTVVTVILFVAADPVRSLITISRPTSVEFGSLTVMGPPLESQDMKSSVDRTVYGLSALVIAVYARLNVLVIVNVFPVPDVEIPVPPRTLRILAAGIAVPESVTKDVGTAGLELVPR